MLRATKKKAGTRGDDPGLPKRRLVEEPFDVSRLLRPLSNLSMTSAAQTKSYQLFRKDLISAMRLRESQKLAQSDYWTITDKWRVGWERAVQVPANASAMALPKVTEIDNPKSRNFVKFELPKDKYIHLTRDSDYQPDRHQLSTTPAQAELVCSYDLDATDTSWLNIFNSERSRAGALPINEDQFEKVIEELEFRTWDKMQSIILFKESLGIEGEEKAWATQMQEIQSNFFNHVSVEDVCSHIVDIDRDAIVYIRNYWKIKRRAGHNRALLPPKSINIHNSTVSDMMPIIDKHSNDSHSSDWTPMKKKTKLPLIYSEDSSEVEEDNETCRVNQFPDDTYSSDWTPVKKKRKLPLIYSEDSSEVEEDNETCRVNQFPDDTYSSDWTPVKKRRKLPLIYSEDSSEVEEDNETCRVNQFPDDTYSSDWTPVKKRRKLPLIYSEDSSEVEEDNETCHVNQFPDDSDWTPLKKKKKIPVLIDSDSNEESQARVKSSSKKSRERRKRKI